MARRLWASMSDPTFPDELFVVACQSPLGYVYYEGFTAEQIRQDLGGGEVVAMYRFQKQYQTTIALEETAPDLSGHVPF